MTKTVVTKDITAATEGAAVKRQEDLMGPKLREVSDRWVNIRRQSSVEDVKTFWQMAGDVLEVESDPDTYGDNATARLFGRHGMEKSAIRNYLAVRRRLDQATIDDVIEYNLDQNESQYGLITVSHLIVLAQCDTPKQRTALLRRIKREKLSVASTADHLKATRDPGEGGLGDKSKRRVNTILNKLTKSSTEVLEGMSFVGDEAFAEAVDGVHKKDIEAAIQRCDSAKEAIQQICMEGESRIQALDNARQKLIDRRNVIMSSGVTEEELSSRRTTNKRKLAAEAAAAAADTPAKPAKATAKSPAKKPARVPKKVTTPKAAADPKAVADPEAGTVTGIKPRRKLVKRPAAT